MSQSKVAQASNDFWLQATTFLKAPMRWQARPFQEWRRIFPVQAVDYQWNSKSRILAAIAITVRLVYSTPVWADMLYFADGHPTTGKVVRVTSELIELQPTSNGWHRLVEEPIPQVVRRTELMNRQDVLEVRGRKAKTYLGEVMYMDSFAVEMRTNEGTVRIPRFKMRKLTLGSLPAGYNNIVNQPVPQVPQAMSSPMQVATPADASPSTSAASALAKSVPSLNGPPSLRIPMDSVAPEPGVEPVYYQKPIDASSEPGATANPMTRH